MHGPGERFIGKYAVVAVNHLVAHLRARAHGGTLRRRYQARPQFLQGRGLGMAQIIERLREIRHHVGRRATAGDHVVHADFLRHVFPQHIGHHIHRLHTVECGATPFGSDCSVGRHTTKTEFGRLVGECRGRVGLVAISRVPHQHRIHVFKQAGTHHIHLAGPTFFRRCAIEADRAAHIVFFHPVAHRHRGRYRTRTKQVVAAGVAAVFVGCRFPHRGGCLGNPG